MDVILRGRTQLEARTANDGVRHAALRLYTLVPRFNLSRRLCLLCLLSRLTIISSYEIFHRYLLIYWIRAIPCNTQVPLRTQQTIFLYFVVPNIMPHYHLFFDGLKF